MKNTLILLFIAVTAAGCNLGLVDPTATSTLVKPTPVYTGSNPKPWYIVSDGLSTGDWVGGVGAYVWNGGATQAHKDAFFAGQTINFSDTKFPFSGTSSMSIAYSTSVTAAVTADIWGGGATIIHTPDFNTYPSVPGKNISSMGFTKCTFWAASPESRKIEFLAQGVSTGYVQLTPTYQKFTINLPAPGTQTAVKDFFGFNVSPPNTLFPGTIYIDDMRYE